MGDTTATQAPEGPGTPPWRPGGEPADPPTRAPGRRWPRVLVLLLGIAVLGRLLFTPDVPTDVLELPPADRVRAAQLADGTPVFLVHTDDGDAHVVEALLPDVDGPVGELVSWCPVNERFVAAHLGAQFALDGSGDPRGLGGRGDGSIGGTDLVGRAFDRLDGRGDADDPLLVGERLAPDESATERAGGVGPDVGSAPPPACQVPADPLVPPPPSAIPPPVDRLLDHGFQARTLSLPRDRWQITDGWLLVAADGTTTWCRVQPTGDPPSCPDPAPVPVDLGLTDADTGGTWAVVGGPLAARVQEGAVREVAVLGRSTWRGSSLRGGLVLEGTLVAVDAEIGEVVLVDVDAADRGPRRCGRTLGGETAADAGGVIALPVGGDTAFDVAGLRSARAVVDRFDGTAEAIVEAAREAAGPGEAVADPPPQGPDGGEPVVVVIDAATCRALRVTDG